jgi:hypothetical protein
LIQNKESSIKRGNSKDKGGAEDTRSSIIKEELINFIVKKQKS